MGKLGTRLHFLNNFLIGSALFSICAFCSNAAQSPQRIHSEISDLSRFTVNGNVHPAVTKASDQGAVAGSTAMPGMAIHFAMTPSQNADMLQLLRLQQTRHSNQYHQWLTPDQYAERFGLNEKDIEKVSAWLETMGFSNVTAGRTRSFVTFDGTASQVQAAFRTPIHRYVTRNGEAHFANAAAPELPAALNGLVVGIRGLHDFHPKPFVRPHFTSSISGNHFLTPDDFATIYDVQATYGKGITGSGRTIGIPGQTDILVSDIEAFEKAAGLPVKDPTLMLTGRDPGTQINTGDLSESDLDLEWAGGIAKGATILYVYSTDVFTSVTYIVDNNLADVVPITYGACEAQFGSSEMAQLNTLFQTAASMGITVIGASGDNGAADCDGATTNTQIVPYATQGLAVDFPASSPYVTGMGGTEFNEGSGSYWNTTNDAYGGSATSYIPEIAWNDTSGANGIEGSGGGASSSYAKPSWQSGSGVPADGKRDVPDLALDSSPNVDGLLYCSNGWCVNGFRNASQDLDVTGGTSAASPAFGAIVALLDQETGSRQGNVNQNLYILASTSSNAFHDITSGNNIVPCQGGTPNCSSSNAAVQGTFGYSAGVGYDQVTGLGTVDVNNMIDEWAGDFNVQATPTSLTINPGAFGVTTIQVSPSGNFTGNVTFTCSVQSTLTNVTCSVPGTVTAAAGSVNLTVTAGANARTPWWHRMPHFPADARGLVSLFAGLILAAIACQLARQRKLRAFAFAFTILLVVGLSSCGGNSSNSESISTIGTTGPETGTVTVTGTSGTLTNSVTVSVSIT